MGVAVRIPLLLCAVSAVFSIPTPDTKRTGTTMLGDSIKTLKVRPDSCRQLSETFGTLAKNWITIPNSLFTDMTPEITEDEMEQIFEMLFGFDIVNDHQARENYTCEITRSQTVSQLIQILDDKDVLFNVFRLMYDSTSMWIRATKQRTSDTQLIAFIDALESAGLMDLDQRRVEWLSHVGSLEYYWPPIGHVPVQEVPGSLSTTGSYIASKFMVLIRDKLPYSPRYQILISMIHQITGVDVTDSYIMESFFSELVGGASSGAQGLYEVFQRHGVIRNVLKAGYPYIQIYEPMWREQLESMIKRKTIKPMPWCLFISKYDLHYPRTYQILSQHFDMTRRTQIVHGLQHDETLPRDPRLPVLTEAVQNVVDFLWQLEASSLLRLPNDV